MRRGFDETLQIATAAGHVVVHRRHAPGRPTAVFTHGTGFCAAAWLDVLDLLDGRFDVVAIDRRGHGLSSAPVDDYEIADFADDAVRVIDELDVRDAYAIGHSAGATDLLLAAVHRPAAFRRLFVIEPTAMDPAEPDVRAEMAPFHRAALDTFSRRRATFPDRQAVVERYTDRGAFAGWRAELLEAFVDAAFRDLGDGSVTLRCAPASEVAMLRRIFAVMEGSYRPPGGNPFEALHRIARPTLVVTSEQSQDIYREMSAVVRRLVPSAEHVHLDGLGHTAAQVDPARVTAEILRWWESGPVTTVAVDDHR